MRDDMVMGIKVAAIITACIVGLFAAFALVMVGIAALAWLGTVLGLEAA